MKARPFLGFLSLVLSLVRAGEDDWCTWLTKYASLGFESDPMEASLAAETLARAHEQRNTPYRCGGDLLVRLSERDASPAGRAAVAEVAIQSRHATTSVIDGVTLLTVYHNLARLAGPIEKGEYLRASMDLHFDADAGYAAAKNYAYWAEQRGNVPAARAALEKAISAVRLSEAARSPSAVGASTLAGLRLFNASLCPPHFSGEAEARARYADLVNDLDRLLEAFARERRARSPSFSQRRSRRLPRDLYLASPLRAVGNLPVAWPYLGFPVRPLNERLAAAYRLISSPSLTSVAPEVTARRPLTHACSAVLRRASLAGADDAGADDADADADAAPWACLDGRSRAEAQSTHRRPIRLAVVAEAHGNTSPGQLIGGVLEGLASRTLGTSFQNTHEEDDPWRGEAAATGAATTAPREFEIIWVELAGLSTGFAERMRRIATSVVLVGENSAVDDDEEGTPLESAEDPAAVARRAIAAQRPDVILYLALGLTPLTYVLAQARLAPVQVSFGHGHPLTSGAAHGSIDYLVSSLLFEPPPPSDARRAGAGGAATAAEGSSAAPPPLPPPPPTGGGRRREDALKPALATSTAEDYSEQLVLFDTLTTSFASPYGDSERPRGDRYSRTALFRRLGLFDAAARASGSFGGDVEAAHVHLCLQHSKKLHPRFDAALRGVLEADARAVVVLLEGAKAHLPRWGGGGRGEKWNAKSGGHGGHGGGHEGPSSLAPHGDATVVGEEEKEASFGPNATALLERLVFVPRMPHAALLALLGVADAFMDTFPWGAGVTSFEAFAACVPVVTLPREITVLQLALGQYRQMGLADDLVANDVDEYVRLITRLGKDPIFRAHMRGKICNQKHRLFNQQAVVDEWATFLRNAAPLEGTRHTTRAMANTGETLLRE